MRLEELLDRLPRNAEVPRLVAPQGDAFDASPQTVPGYVSPTFTVTDWPGNSAVLLIEAAGAVGKSAAAAAIADTLKWPLVRAERAQVGSYSLSGLVQDALGFGGEYVRGMSEGKQGVVVDALDEAHFRAGTDNFLAFIDNIQKLSGASAASGPRRPSIVLLSRSDTAELVRLSFATAELALAEARLDFFDLTGAQAFITAHLEQRFGETQRSEYNVHLGWPIPFARLRDDRFKQLARVLLRSDEVDLQAQWADVQDFLGYTPVLVAIAESLAVQNPAREVLRIAENADAPRLLRDIIESVLTREHGKFGPRL